MITMAAVTMLFLPGTFISSILSTTFFDYGEDKLSVSKEWWVLPAVVQFRPQSLCLQYG